MVTTQQHIKNNKPISPMLKYQIFEHAANGTNGFIYISVEKNQLLILKILL